MRILLFPISNWRLPIYCTTKHKGNCRFPISDCRIIRHCERISCPKARREAISVSHEYRTSADIRRLRALKRQRAKASTPSMVLSPFGFAKMTAGSGIRTGLCICTYFAPIGLIPAYCGGQAETSSGQVQFGIFYPILRVPHDEKTTISSIKS